MTYRHLLVADDGPIRTITLNWPEKRNALALDVMRELTAALEAAGASEANGVILAANGPVFSAGHNFGDMAGATLDQARQLFESRCRHFAEPLGVTMTGLRLSSAQTRWGSASADGMIRLNWRLIHFSPALIDYVVAHELAHLKEMNHSPRFWAVVRSVFPEYELARDRLKQAVLPLMDEA